MLLARVHCSAGQGFGSPGGQRKPAAKGGKGAKGKGITSGDSKAVQRAVRLVEEQDAKQQGQRQGGGIRPVDPREAARGKVEFVKVRDWGSGAPEDLGHLQLEGEATRVFAAGASDADAADAGGAGGSGSGSEESTRGAAAPAMPFHEVLARRLELLQSQGALGGLAQAPGGRPLPPFDRWAFAAGHYRQYLADLYAVHAALEGSMAAAIGAEAAALAAGAGAAAPASSPQHERLHSVLQLFGPEVGLARSAALLQDLRRLSQALPTQQQEQQPGPEQQQQEPQEACGGGDAPPAAATQHAAAYAAYIASLARLQAAAEGPKEEEQPVLRLAAHAYILYLSHLTSGGRIGAAASQQLGLAQAGALAFYSDYPQLPEGARPLERLVAAANRLGELLSPDQQEAVMEELPKAIKKASLLLTPLAQEA